MVQKLGQKEPKSPEVRVCRSAVLICICEPRLRGSKTWCRQRKKRRIVSRSWSFALQFYCNILEHCNILPYCCHLCLRSYKQSNHSSRQEKTTLLDRMKKEPPVQDTWQEDRPGSSDHTLVCHCLSIFSLKYTQVTMPGIQLKLIQMQFSTLDEICHRCHLKNYLMISHDSFMKDKAPNCRGLWLGRQHLCHTATWWDDLRCEASEIHLRYP